MKKIKDILHEIFIDGLGGMAIGLFATLIIGTIINQIAGWIPGVVGDALLMMGKLASAATGAGIGIGCAVKLKAKPLTIVSSAVAGMVGAFASKLQAGTVLVEGTVTLAGPGEPLGAFLAAMTAI